MTESTCRVTCGGWGVRSPSPRQTESEKKTVLRLRRLLSRLLRSRSAVRSGARRKTQSAGMTCRLHVAAGAPLAPLRCDRVTGRLAERGRLLSRDPRGSLSLCTVLLVSFKLKVTELLVDAQSNLYHDYETILVYLG
jgi:hypothetical protein